MSQMEAMKRFMVMRPPSFNGEPSQAMSIAYFWWESMKRVYDTEVMTREEFEIFLGKYFGRWLSMPRGWSLSTSSKEPCQMINEEGEKARRFQQGLRLAIRNRLVPLAIRDYSELVKRALLVEQDIEETNQIREQRGDRKGKQRMGESSQGRSQGPQQRQRTQQSERHSSFYAGGEPLMEGLPIAGCTRSSTSSLEVVNNNGSVFPASSPACLTTRCHNYPNS
ncbi:hypothetical protein AAG906_007651 [Vitis piasezkii]